jgi:hypothetical protein
MAVIRFGPIVQSASGALAGMVFSRQGGTSIVRTRPLLCNRQTARQLQVRNNYALALRWWRAMSDTNRLAWFRCAQTYRHTKPDGTSNPLTAWQTYATVALRLLDTPYGFFAEDLAPDPWFGQVETLGIRIDVWPAGPVNMVHSRGTLTEEPPDVISLVYDLAVQRTFRTYATLPGRLTLRAWHDTSRTYSNNLLSTYNAIRGNINSTWTPVAGSPTVGEFIRWFCLSHLMAWPASTLWSGLSQVPNVSSELITNGDFELPDDGGYAARTGWTTNAPSTITTETFDVWGDAYSIHWIVPASAGTQYLYTPFNINVSLAATYTIRFAARAVAGGANFVARLISSTYVTLLTHTFTLPNDGIWYEYSYSGTIAPGYTLAQFYFLRSTAPAAQIYVDNVSIRRTL